GGRSRSVDVLPHRMVLGSDTIVGVGRRGLLPAPTECRQVDLLELLLEDLARLEAHDGAFRNHHRVTRLVRVSADTLPANLDFQDAEVAELDVAAVGEGALDDVESLLDGVDDLLLREARLAVDLEDDFAFGKISHRGDGLRFSAVSHL